MKDINIAKLKDGKLEPNGESRPVISEYNPQLYGAREQGQLSIWKINNTKVAEVAASIAAQIVEGNVNAFFLQGVADAQKAELYNKIQENLTDSGSAIELLPYDPSLFKQNGSTTSGNMFIFTTPPYTDAPIDPTIQSSITEIEKALPNGFKKQVQLRWCKAANNAEQLLVNIDLEGSTNPNELEAFITKSIAQFSLEHPHVEILIAGTIPPSLNIPNKNEDGKKIQLNPTSNLNYFQGAKGSSYQPYLDPSTNLPIKNYYREESSTGLFILPPKNNANPTFYEEIKNLATYNNPHIAHKILFYEKENNDSVIASNEKPAANVDRANLLYQGNLQNIKIALANYSPDWVIEKRFRDDKVIKAYNQKTGDSIYIYPDKIIIKCDSLDAYKAALVCFCAPPRENVTPQITTSSEEAKQKWIEAIKALPQLNIKADPATLVKVVEIKPEPTNTPKP